MVEKIVLIVAWLVAAPVAAAPSVSEWQPRAPADPAVLDTPHLYAERLHERWIPASIDWAAPREFAIDMVCDLGLITLAIMDCNGLTADRAMAHPAGVLILAPLKPGASGRGASQPDFRDLRRRPIEERMHSI